MSLLAGSRGRREAGGLAALVPLGAVALRAGLGAPRFPAAAFPPPACSSRGCAASPACSHFPVGSFSLGYFCLCRLSRRCWAPGMRAQLGKRLFPAPLRGLCSEVG